MKVQGLDRVLSNLNREVKKIEGRSKAGVLEAALFIEGETLEVTPQDMGDLINSSFSDSDSGTGSGPRARVGFTAAHAPFVHEMPDSTNWSKPGTGNKFLEKTVKSHLRDILDIIREKARIR